MPTPRERNGDSKSSNELIPVDEAYFRLTGRTVDQQTIQEWNALDRRSPRLWVVRSGNRYLTGLPHLQRFLEQASALTATGGRRSDEASQSKLLTRFPLRNGDEDSLSAFSKRGTAKSTEDGREKTGEIA